LSGWASAAHLFACNRYRLGAGTINNPDWKIGDAKKVYVTRALTAIASQWDIHRDESNYFQDYVGAGNQDFPTTISTDCVYQARRWSISSGRLT
jgi:hypothetical protein